MATVNVKLDSPIEINGKTIGEINLRTPKVKEIRQIAKMEKDGIDDIDTAVDMLVMLGDLTAEEIDEMDSADLFKASGELTAFFTAGGKSGSGVQ